MKTTPLPIGLISKIMKSYSSEMPCEITLTNIQKMVLLSTAYIL